MPLRLGKFHHRLGQVFFVDQFRVEGDDSYARGDTDPGAVARNIFLGQYGQGRGVGLGQQALLAEFVQGRGFFGVDHISGGAVAFFDNLAGQLIAAALADIHMDAGLGFESLGYRVADFLVLTVVQGQGNRIGCLGEGGCQGQPQQSDGQATQKGCWKEGISEHHSQVSSL